MFSPTFLKNTTRLQLDEFTHRKNRSIISTYLLCTLQTQIKKTHPSLRSESKMYPIWQFEIQIENV